MTRRTILRTKEFNHWLSRESSEATRRVERAIERLGDGRFGDIKDLGAGLREARIFAQGGLRIYFAAVGSALILLVLGGRKDSQSRDIAKARAILEQLRWNERLGG